jgi:hypothetical protein
MDINNVIIKLVKEQYDQNMLFIEKQWTQFESNKRNTAI